MVYSLLISERAKKDIKKLDVAVRKKLVAKLKEIQQHTDPISLAKPLSGHLTGLYRWRIGAYRVIFEIEGAGVIKIHAVKHRRNAYE